MPYAFITTRQWSLIMPSHGLNQSRAKYEKKIGPPCFILCGSLLCWLFTMEVWKVADCCLQNLSQGLQCFPNLKFGKQLRKFFENLERLSYSLKMLKFWYLEEHLWSRKQWIGLRLKIALKHAPLVTAGKWTRRKK